ncbi:hypothetical protein GCM10010330_16320 [Streptomyces tendae]|uniref:DUF6907 domain-containing protein n=1 Tax=Streptomyces tendae TaxID=1932 RepID=UPI00167234B6|nr:hypothetical protein [Streptomyces tendae]GHA64242.1 hypothetical protein GCM10010330_16320 [Streptomyces tendae]
MTTPRTVTVRTIDHGAVTVTCPDWCTTQHQDDGYRADVFHQGEPITLRFHGRHVGDASIVHAPFAERSSREPEASVTLLLATLAPGGLYDFAAALDTHADQLRALADHLTELRGGSQ